MRPLGPAIAIAVAVGLAAAPAAAQRAGVAVVPAARPAAPAADVTRAVADAAGADGDAVARARRMLAAGAVPVAELAGFAQVARLTREGWRAYLVEVDAEFAAARLASARARAEALLALDGGLEVYAEVSLRLGLVLAHLGRDAEAADALRLAHALDPERAVTPAEFSPDAVAAFDAAVATVPPRRDVTIAAPARSTVIVDGTDLGRAPLAVELSVGQHVLVVTPPGGRARGQAVQVGPASERVDVDVTTVAGPPAVTDPAALAAGAGEERAGAAVADVLLYAELDELFVVASVYRAGGPALIGQRCGAGRPACTAVIEIGHPPEGLAAAARELVERLRAARFRYGVILPGDARVARAERIAGGGRCGWCRSGWTYAAGGVVVAAVVAAVVAIAVHDEPVPTVIVDPGDFTR